MQIKIERNNNSYIILYHGQSSKFCKESFPYFPSASLLGNSSLQLEKSLAISKNKGKGISLRKFLFTQNNKLF